MEVQAMQSGRRGRDEALTARLLDKRRAKIAESTEPAETVYLLRARAGLDRWNDGRLNRSG
jgi:hypothetical protein